MTSRKNSPLRQRSLRQNPPLKFSAWLLVCSALLFSGCQNAQDGLDSSGTPAPEAQAQAFTLTAPSATSEPTSSPTVSETPIPPTQTPTETIAVSATPSPTFTETPTPTNTEAPPTPSGDEAIYAYYVQTDTGGPVGCGDTLVKVNMGAWRTGDVETDVAEALRWLFMKREYVAGLYNPVYLSNLEVVTVDFKAYDGLVSVDLSGTYVRSGDRCDDGRVRAQIWTTIRQFPGVKTVYILLNGNLLGDILATRNN